MDSAHRFGALMLSTWSAVRMLQMIERLECFTYSGGLPDTHMRAHVHLWLIPVISAILIIMLCVWYLTVAQNIQLLDARQLFIANDSSQAFLDLEEQLASGTWETPRKLI